MAQQHDYAHKHTPSLHTSIRSRCLSPKKSGVRRDERYMYSLELGTVYFAQTQNPYVGTRHSYEHQGREEKSARHKEG